MTNKYEGILKLNISFLDIEHSDGCHKDNLTIFEGIVYTYLV